MLQIGDTVKIIGRSSDEQYGVIVEITKPHTKTKIAGIENNTHIVEVGSRQYRMRFNPNDLQKVDHPIQFDYSEIEREKNELYKVGNHLRWETTEGKFAYSGKVVDVIEVKPHVYEYVISMLEFGAQMPSNVSPPKTIKINSARQTFDSPKPKIIM